MWPWGHLALGYLCYSAVARTTDWRIGDREAVVLAVATQFPDLIDKTLAWVFDVFASGYAAGHSVFVAVPVGVTVVVVALARRRVALGVAFAFGYWSHLLGDVLLAVVLRQPYTVSRVLWPVVSLPGDQSSLGAVQHVGYYLVQFLDLLQTTANPAVVLIYLGPLLAATSLWVLDGTPGLRGVRTRLTRLG